MNVKAQQFPNLKFTHLSVKDGLSSYNIGNIIQDNRGTMWISTAEGLNRYDGTSFKLYLHNPKDSSTISDNGVIQMVIDDENMIWMSTGHGLCRFNPTTGKAINNYYHQQNNSNSLSDNYESNPFIDSKHRLWLATHKGVQLFDYKKNKFTTYNMPSLPLEEGKESFNYFPTIHEDAKQRLWASSLFGMYLIDEKQQQLILYPENEIAATNCIYATSNDNIYLGQWGRGLKIFKPETNQYIQQNTIETKLDIVHDINEWRDNDFNNWLCIADDEGFILKNLKINQFKIYTHDILNPFSLSSNDIRNIYKDKDNRLWISTSTGINIIDPQLQYFNNHYIYQNIDKNNVAAFGNPRSIIETNNGYLLSSWYAKGLFYFDNNWNLLKQKKHVPENATNIYSACINSIYKNTNGDLWFSTDSGLVKQKGNNYKVFIPPNAKFTIRGDYIVRDITPRKDGLWWLKGRQNGIYIFDPIKEKFVKQYKLGKKNLDGDVYKLCYDNYNILWIGTSTGIFKFNEKEDLFEQTKYILNNDTLNFEDVTDMVCDSNNIIWAATIKGLGKINTQANSATLINKITGLPDTELLNIKEDKQHILWIKSKKGIVRFDKERNFQFFNTSNGLPDYYNVFGLFDFNNSGNILCGFGGIITEFNPSKISINKQKPNIILYDISIDNKASSLAVTDSSYTITLEPNETTLQVHFAIPSYTASPTNKFFYRIPGIDNKWTEASLGNINFSSLPNGNYILYIKASNNNGIFSDERKISINKKPHWYQTNFFKILFLLLIGFAIFYFVRRRIALIRRESALKQQITETEIAALKAQMNPHFIFNCINSIDGLIQSNDKYNATNYLNTFAKLIRNILDSSMENTVPLSKDVETLNLYIELEKLRSENKFSTSVNITNELLNSDYKVPPLIIQPFVENAIHHGLRNRDDETGQLKINIERIEDKIVYTIEDSGVGREATAKMNNQHKHYGMQMSIDRIKMFNNENKASIKIDDLYTNGIGVGTKVVVQLKIK